MAKPRKVNPLTVRAWAPHASPALRHQVAVLLCQWRRNPALATPAIALYYSASPYGSRSSMAQRLAVMRYTL